VGDSAYPLEVKLMVPYRDNGHLTEEQKAFNLKLSGSRCAIERAFGLLKGKFRRLKYLDVNNVSSVPDIIIAACTLYNFILQNDGTDADVSVDESEDVSSCAADYRAVTDKAATRKRDEIAAML